MSDREAFGDRFAGRKLDGVTVARSSTQQEVREIVKTHPDWSREQIKAEVKSRLAEKGAAA